MEIVADDIYWGSNVDLDGALFSAVVGALVGTLGGGAITAWTANESAKLQATVALINEWHSADMRQCRADAERILDALDVGLPEAMRVLAARLEEPAQNVRDGALRSEHALSQVAHFFEKFQVLLAAGQLKRNIAASGMGSIVRWWSKKLLKDVPLNSYSGTWKKLLDRVGKLDGSLGSDG